MNDARFTKAEPVPGFRSVRRVWDEAYGVPRAMRTLDLPESAWDEVRDRVRKMARLNHPTLVRPVAVGAEHGELRVVEEWVEGTSLRTRVADGGPMTFPSALALVEPVVDLLDLCHGLGIAHGALSPDAVIVMPDGRPRLVGLGVRPASAPADLEGVGHLLMAVLGDASPSASVTTLIRDAMDGGIPDASVLLTRLRNARDGTPTDSGMDLVDDVPGPPDGDLEGALPAPRAEEDQGPHRRTLWMLLALLFAVLLVVCAALTGWLGQEPAPMPVAAPTPSVAPVVETPRPVPESVAVAPAPAAPRPAPARPVAAPEPVAEVTQVEVPEPVPTVVIVPVPEPPAPVVAVVAVPEPEPEPAPPPPPAPNIAPMGKWRVQERAGRKHPITTLVLDAENRVTDRLGRPGLPQLQVRCAERRLSVVVDPGVEAVEAVVAENTLYSVMANVAATWSGQGSEKLKAHLKEHDQNLYLPHPRDFVSNTRATDGLYLSYTPFASKSVVATFDVVGMDVALAEIVDYCKF